MEQFTALKRKALEKYFSRMNDQQRKAVFKIKGPLLILAGAGSGKTTVLVNRIANMIYFGNAYNTEQTYGTPSEQDIQFLKDYQCLSLQLCGIKCEGYFYTSICCLSCKGSFCGYTNRLSACLIHNGSLYHIGLSRRQTLVCYGIH